MIKQKTIVIIWWILMITSPLISLLVCYILYHYSKFNIIFLLSLLLEPLHMVYYICLKYYINRYQNLSALEYVRSNFTNEKRVNIWIKAIDAAHAYSFEKWYMSWFDNKTFNNIRYEDAERFVSWVTFGVFTANRNELKLYMEEIEKRTKNMKTKEITDKNHHTVTIINRENTSSPTVNIPLLDKNESTINYDSDGITTSVELIAVTRKKIPLYAPSLAKISSVYHPLWFYVMKSSIQFWFENLSLPRLGFKVFDNDVITRKLPAHQAGCKVFYRLVSQNLKERPILLFHGMGAGVTPYEGIIRELIKRYPTRSIFVLYIPQISMTYRMELPPLTEIATLVEAVVLSILKSDFTNETVEVDIMAHSLGTCVAVNVMQRPRIKCHSVIMADPAAISCCLPDMIQRLFFDTNYTGIFDILVRSEIHTMYAIQRRLDWMEAFIGGLGHVCVLSSNSKNTDNKINNKNVTQVTHVHNFTIFLSSRDMMIPFLGCGRIIKRLLPGALIEVFEGTHGQWLTQNEKVQKFVSALE